MPPQHTKYATDLKKKNVLFADNILDDIRNNNILYDRATH